VAEAVSELDNDEAMVYKNFFVTGFRMPSHAALVDILLHFQTQLHQLTPNAIAQLSKYFWAVGSFGGVPTESVFAKWYELHYQPKTAETPEGIESHNMDVWISMLKEMGVWYWASRSRRSGWLGEQHRGFTIACLVSEASRAERACMPCTHGWASWIMPWSPK
jgi:hypothetical protein